ncbi:MAG: putative heme-binding domain-containing protein [Verrucomicrobiales bacterium]|jgi:putative heme-binding domain-containing protein
MKFLTPFLFSFALVSLAFGQKAKVPEGLEAITFAGPDIVPSPACLAVAPTGEVFVGVDLNGSLGKGPGKGRIVRLVDSDNDGVADSHTVFAEIDNPRGIQPIGDRLIVLHTVIPKDTGVLEALHLSELRDEDGDGVADGPPKILVSDLSPPKHNVARGADHTTNGIRLGIDGWIYIAVGDFGIHGAKGTDGTELTMLGGGIVRVRPDGTELEVYTHGLRNIYDVAIDPLMNIYTRGNTNDGGGWNVRFIHQIQSAEYGYPMLFKHFTNEILPALQDLGGGSGTGALYFEEPGWPEAFNHQPMMCDWGRSWLVIHDLTPDGASFTQEPVEFIRLGQISDADVDASGRLYLSAWDGAGYKGSDQKGFVERVTPVGWKFAPSPDFDGDVALLKSESATVRLHASQDLIARGKADPSILGIAKDASNSLETRVAAIFTWKQLLGVKANADLAELVKDETIREWALRAIADRKTQLDGAGLAPFLAGLKDANPRVQVAAAVGLGRLGDPAAAEALLAVSNPPLVVEEEVEPSVPPVFVSEVLRNKDLEKVDVEITGFEKLFLVVSDGGDGTGNDHAAWFDPELVMADGSTQPMPKKWLNATQGWGKTARGKSATGGELKRPDGTPSPNGIGTHTDSLIVFEVPEGAARFRVEVGLADTHKGGSVQFSVGSTMPPAIEKKEGPHAEPNSAIVLPHIAVKALVEIGDWKTVLASLDGPNRRGALSALKYQHEPQVVDSLFMKLGNGPRDKEYFEIVEVLARVAQKEAPYDGSWWWSTRPDTHGPYYKPVTWERTEAIHAALKRLWEIADPDEQAHLAMLNEKNRTGIDGMKIEVAAKPKMDEPKVDLGAITAGQGETGKASIEDVMLALDKIKGNAKRGRVLFTQQGCVACHTLTLDEAPKGPFMGQVGAVLNREQIAESILKPSASISQGFATVLITKKDGGVVTGFVTAQSAEKVELRDIAGQVHSVAVADIKERMELEVSMMPPGLANALSMEDFASLIAFLAGQKGE